MGAEAPRFGGLLAYCLGGGGFGRGNLDFRGGGGLGGLTLLLALTRLAEVLPRRDLTGTGIQLLRPTHGGALLLSVLQFGQFAGGDGGLNAVAHLELAQLRAVLGFGGADGVIDGELASGPSDRGRAAAGFLRFGGFVFLHMTLFCFRFLVVDIGFVASIVEIILPSSY